MGAGATASSTAAPPHPLPLRGHGDFTWEGAFCLLIPMGRNGGGVEEQRKDAHVFDTNNKISDLLLNVRVCRLLVCL